jgi:hypothetical protein
MVYLLASDSYIRGGGIFSFKCTDDNDRKKIQVEDSTPDGGMLFDGRAFESGRRVKLENFPPFMINDHGNNKPDFATCLGYTYVSDAFKDIIENFEPNVHQFVPFDVVDTKRLFQAKMWFMVVCNRRDGVDRSLTTMYLSRGEGGEGFWRPQMDKVFELPRDQWPKDFDPKVGKRLVFNNAQIGSCHMWQDKHMLHGGPYISDQLAEALTAAKLKGVVMAKKETV